MSVKSGGRETDVPYFTGTASGQPDGAGQLLLLSATLLSALGMSDMLMKIHSLALARLAFLYESFGESAGP